MLPPLLQAAKATGARVFIGTYDLNLIGIRHHRTTANQWDDLLACLYLDETNAWRGAYWPATTDPGLPHLVAPMRSAGCAVLVPAQYLGAYKEGLHKGRAALVQIAPVQVYRDNNKDDQIDTSPATIQTLDYSLNIHSVARTVSDAVNSWSAGCQVLRHVEHMAELLALLEKQAEHGHGDRVSYTLITAAQCCGNQKE
tara:strand:+ start:5706 stop:6299 length:594 start_codon:yes stop_codon:yes gene_type:complete